MLFHLHFPDEKKMAEIDRALLPSFVIVLYFEKNKLNNVCFTIFCSMQKFR